MGRATSQLQKTDMLRDMQLASARPGNKASSVEFYSFYVINIQTQVIEKQYGFDIPPQTIEHGADFAAEAIALQEGNYFTDERGQYFKMLSMSGTFGFRPTRGKSSSIDNSGLKRSISQIQQAGAVIRGDSPALTVPSDERTGWDRQADLENLFHFYAEKKMHRATAASYVFVYANWKLGEVYVAQPLSIRRTRTAPSDRFKHKYVLSVRLLAPLSVKGVPKDFLPAPNKDLAFYFDRARRAAARVETSIGLVKDSMGSITSFLVQYPKQALSTARSFTDLIRSGGDIVTEALDNVDVLINAVGAFGTGTVNAFVFTPLESYRTTMRRVLEAKGTFESLGGNAAGKFREIGTNLSDVLRSISDMYIGLTVTEERGDVNDAARAIGNLYRPSFERNALDTDRIPRGRTPLFDRGSNTSLGGRGIPKGSQEVTLPGGTSIKEVASRFLGESGRWKEIVLLNNLRPPYISAQGDGISVLRPGDKINIPMLPLDDNDQAQVFTTLTMDQEGSDARKYGRDLWADPDTLDILVNEYGDLGVIEGLDNLRQAMTIKVKTRPGDLKMHPWFGFSGEVGTGIEIDKLARQQLQVRDTLLSDSRIDTIESLSVRASGDLVLIRASLVPKDNDDRLSLNTRSRLGG